MPTTLDNLQNLTLAQLECPNCTFWTVNKDEESAKQALLAGLAHYRGLNPKDIDWHDLYRDDIEYIDKPKTLPHPIEELVIGAMYVDEQLLFDPAKT